jgi:hypothetical protein
MVKKKSFELIDLEADIQPPNNVTIVYSYDLKKFLRFVESISNVKSPTPVVVTRDGQLYFQTANGEVFIYNGDELSEWRKQQK